MFFTNKIILLVYIELDYGMGVIKINLNINFELSILSFGQYFSPPERFN